MIRNKKVVVVTPAGRQKYMELLSQFILPNELVDEWQIWQNTINDSDINYFKNLFQDHNKVNVIKVPNDKPNCDTICKYFPYSTQKNAVYLRLDDDVVWMEPDAIEKIINFRLDNPEYFLVYGNTINNALCDFLHQKQGALQIEEKIEYECCGRLAWNNVHVAEKKHRNFIELYKRNELHKYKFENHVLKDYERCSINAISWLGATFAKFDGIVGESEEVWLSCYKPHTDKIPNIIYGDSLFVHFAFHTQRQHLDATDILDFYKSISPFGHTK